MATPDFTYEVIIDGVDVTGLVRNVRFGVGDVTQVGTGSLGIDATVSTANLVLAADASLNALFYDYSPIVVNAREGVSGPWEEVFKGYLGDSFDWSEFTVTISARDPAKLLQDTQLDNVTSYGSEEGTPMPVVLQQLMTQHLGVNAPALRVWDNPEALIGEYLPRDMSVWDAMQALVNRIGWYLGYIRLDGSYELTLLEPPFDKAPPNSIILTDGDVVTKNTRWSSKDVRNSVTVEYFDVDSDEVERVTLRDEDSIQNVTSGVVKHSHITVETDAGVDTHDAAVRLAQAFLRDMAVAHSTIQVELPFTWEPRLFTELVVDDAVLGTQTYSVNSVQSEVDADGRYRTRVLASGQVRGGLRRWLDNEPRPGSPGDAGQHITQLVRPLLAAVPSTPGVRVASNGIKGVGAVGIELHASDTAGFIPSEDTFIISGQSTSWTLPELTPGERYYFLAREFDARGGLGPWSAEVTTLAGSVPGGSLDPDVIAEIAHNRARADVLDANREIWDRSQVITEDLRIRRETIEGDLNQDLADMNASLSTVEQEITDAMNQLDAAH